MAGIFTELKVDSSYRLRTQRIGHIENRLISTGNFNHTFTVLKTTPVFTFISICRSKSES